MGTKSYRRYILVLGVVLLSFYSWVPIQRNMEASALSHVLTTELIKAVDLSLSPTRTIIDCETVQSQSPTNTSIPYLLGIASLHCDNPSVAIGYLEAAVAQCAASGRSAGCGLEQVILGHAFAKADRVDDAFEQWHHEPESVYYLLQIAQEELSVEEPLLAERWARWAVRLDPMASLITVDSVPVNAHTALGAALALQNKWQDAFDAYSAGIVDMTHPQPYITAADIALYRLNDPQAAKIVLDKALRKWPTHMWLNLKLSDVYMHQNEIELAEQLLETISRDCPDNLAVNLYLGTLRYKQGEYSISSSVLQKILQEDENDVTALVYFGLSQNHLGNRDIALQALLKASALSPDSSFVKNALSSIQQTESLQP